MRIISNYTSTPNFQRCSCMDRQTTYLKTLGRAFKRHFARFLSLIMIVLVCIGSTLVMLTSQNIYINLAHQTGDVARMSAQVIAGIGFLGTGTIMVTGRREIKGLTTAAGLWASACIGLACGIDFVFMAGTKPDVP